MHPDEGLVLDDSPTRTTNGVGMALRSRETNGLKRTIGFDDTVATGEHQNDAKASSSNPRRDVAARPSKRVRFAGGSEEE